MDTQEHKNSVQDPDVLFEALVKKIKENTHNMDLGRIRAAYEMARMAHSGQRRRDGSPYVTHCIAAADISVDIGLDEDSIIAALLHDVIEDTSLTHEDIARQFGTAVADIVEGVTKLTRVQYTSKEDEQAENLRKMLLAMAKDIRVILIKIADRLCHASALPAGTVRQDPGKGLQRALGRRHLPAEPQRLYLSLAALRRRAARCFLTGRGALPVSARDVSGTLLSLPRGLFRSRSPLQRKWERLPQPLYPAGKESRSRRHRNHENSSQPLSLFVL